MELGCDKTRLSKVTEFLEILEGRVSASLYGVVVLWTMVDHRVQPLKRRVILLYDYSGVDDPTRETMEMLEVSKVMKQVRGFVTYGTVVAVECAVEAFSVTCRPNLVRRPGSFSFHHSKLIG